MNTVIDVATSEFAIAQAPQILITRGVGSCVVVCLYEKYKKIGALAHIMLPHSENDRLNPHRFVDTALPLLFDELHHRDVHNEDLEAHLIGGASMFQGIDDYLELGEKNVQAAEANLDEIGIPIVGRDVGGRKGRSVTFILETGEIQVTTR